jgi:hypothetical protein
MLPATADAWRPAADQVLAGLGEAEDRQAFRTLLQRLAVHAATALDSTSLDSCTTSLDSCTAPDSTAPDACAAPTPGVC